MDDEIKCASLYNDDDDNVPSSTQVQMLRWPGPRLSPGPGQSKIFRGGGLNNPTRAGTFSPGSQGNYFFILNMGQGLVAL